tara:strand:- start:260 stop:448 length:189 start_codon:yes stop_codon:yes gene_type:complete
MCNDRERLLMAIHITIDDNHSNNYNGKKYNGKKTKYKRGKYKKKSKSKTFGMEKMMRQMTNV